MQLLNFGEWFAYVRNKCLPFTILLVIIPSQISIVRASKPHNEKNFYLMVNADIPSKLDYENIAEIKAGCVEAVSSSLDERLRKSSEKLMLLQEEDSFDWKIDRAEVLLVCKAPGMAQQVLQAIIPSNRLEQRRWSILYWKASNALMDHMNAAFALRRLSEGNLQKLDEELMIVGYRSDGSPLKRSALDLLAEHERLTGHCETAAKVLLAGRKTGALGAKRLALAVQCLEELTLAQRLDLLEKALLEAQSDQAWWLVGDILRLQLILDSSMGEDSLIIRERLENFAKEIDDRYTQLELLRLDSKKEEEKTLMENQLRSPRESTSELEKIRY